MDSLNLATLLNNDNLLNNNSVDTNTSYSDDKLVKFSFYITYAFLMTTATVTFIEAIRTKDPKIRHILNLETCISVVAAFFYGVFMTKINNPETNKNDENINQEINYKDININRYVDWSITTPIMLLVLLLAFCYNNGKSVTLLSFILVLILNYGMLAFGFLGESGKMNKLKANLIGFLFFVLLYGYIYITHIRGFNIFDNNILFYTFIILWSIYGIVYFMNEKLKNVSYNILDLFSKCFVGIFFWAYFTKTIVLN
jgi:bacteriorhodopsin